MCHLPSVKVLVWFILGFVCFVLDEFGAYRGSLNFFLFVYLFAFVIVVLISVLFQSIRKFLVF